MDTTLRDGEQTSGVAFSASEKLSIARKLLEEVRVDRLEIASARVSKGEFECVKAVCEWAVENGKLDCIEVLGFCDNGASIDWIKRAGAKVINLLTKGSEKHCVGQLQKTPEEHLRDIQDNVRMAHEAELRVNIYLEDWSNGILDNPEYVFNLLDGLSDYTEGRKETSEAKGTCQGQRVAPLIDRIMLPDTLGILSPSQTKQLITKMVEAGVHFGHQTRKWHPNMKKYILTQKNGIHIVNLEETEKCLDKACAFLSDLAAKNKKILFVGCKRQAQAAVKDAAEATGQYYVNFRWLGGMLTNMATIKKSIARLDYLENLDKQPEYKSMSKKELAALSREREKLLRNLQGIRNMGGAPDVVVAIGADHEDIAIREAHKLGIPVIVLTDTNADPESVDFPIPGNDDAVRSVRLILSVLVEAINKAKPAEVKA